MSGGRTRDEESRYRWFDRTEHLNRPERIVVLVFVSVSVALDVAGFVAAPGVDWVQRLLSIAVTLTLALYVWSPLVATLALGAIVAVSVPLHGVSDTLLAGALAALLVVRLGTTPLIMAYAGGLLVVTAFVAMGYGSSSAEPTTFSAYLIIATVTGAVGLGLRLALARGQHLEIELAAQEEREREAIRAERRWIAGELHDNIAHHLTIISLHSQLLDDNTTREASQDAIRTAAKKALSDLRFVIRLADDQPSDSVAHSADLVEAVAEARGEFEDAGHTVVVTGDPKDEAIPRAVDLIFARIVRESATNVLKYAGPGPVSITLNVGAESVMMQISSPLPTVPRHDLPSTGTGLNRMAERVLGVSGTFTAGPVGDRWLVSVELPVAPSARTP